MNRNVKDYLILKGDFDFAIPWITLPSGLGMKYLFTDIPVENLFSSENSTAWIAVQAVVVAT